MIKKISITGGIGSGKSTVIQLLADLGYCVWDADALVAEAFKTSDVIKKVKALLGEKSYQDGNVNKHFVRSQIFENSELKAELEHILHPEIGKILEEKLHAIQEQNISCWIFYEASLIFEKKRHTEFDANILITANDKLRIKRIKKHKKWSVEMIQNVMNHQMPAEEKKKMATYVIHNSATKKVLEKKVLKLLQYLKNKFKEKN